jgi:hypothetical protein
MTDKAKVVVRIEFEFDHDQTDNTQAIAEFLVDQILRGKRKFPTKYTKNTRQSIRVLSETLSLDPIE